MATLIGNNKPSMMAFPSALNRMGTFPIDISSVWYSYDEAVAYATQTNFTPKYEGQTGLPYVGQILTVVETAKDGTTSVTAYSIQNEAGDLAQVGTVTLGDNATIVRDEETGTLSLYGIDELTWKDSKGETVTTYQPKLVKDAEGKVTLAWEIPSATTVEGLDLRLITAEGRLTTAEGNITRNAENIAANGKAIEAVEKDLADNYYDKEEVDAKITSVFKFKGTVTYLDKLPASEMVTGDVYLVIYDVKEADYVDGTTPVANIEYVWTGTAWEPLGDDLIDLTDYYTKSQVDNIAKTLVKTVEDGTTAWTVKVTLADGTTITEPVVKTVNASNEVAGLVKGDGTNVSIADGVITVHEAGHANSATTANEATHAGSADSATTAGTANKVAHKFTVLNKEFDGSADQSVTAEEVKTAVGIDNYYTKSEADTNFMSSQETSDAITAVTNPLADEIEAIKGEIPETEGYVLPNLVNVGERLDAHDEAIQGLTTQVETANSTAKTAEDKAKEAKTIADEAKEAATSANTTAGEVKDLAESASAIAGEAKRKAENAVKTAATASDVASEAETKAREAVGAAATAKGTADSALTKAGANETAIKALQGKDTKIESLVNTNTANITTLENTVAAGLADRYTIAQTNSYVAEQIAAIDHLKREVVESLPGTPDANTIYMVPTTEIINKSFSGTTAEGIPSNQFNKIYDIFQSGSTFTIVYNGVKYSNVKAVQTTSSEVEGYNTYRATFGEHYLEYTLGDFRFDVQDSTPYSISWNEYPENNYYVEWIYINQKWEKIGTSEVDLSNYLTKDGAADNTTIGGVKTAEVVANAAKTAEWDQISGKPKGELINTERITITAGNTSVEWTQAVGDMLAAKTFISYQAYLENLENEEVIIGHKTDGGVVHTFEIASAQTSNIIIDINYTSFI